VGGVGGGGGGGRGGGGGGGGSQKGAQFLGDRAADPQGSLGKENWNLSTASPSMRKGKTTTEKAK